jgi:hypothetical protein
MKEKEMKRQIKMTGAAIVDIGRLGASLEKPFINVFLSILGHIPSVLLQVQQGKRVAWRPRLGFA